MQPDFLPRSFFDRPTQSVARELLGCRLIRKLAGTLLVGAIVETEAYIGERDLACHARVGRTPRTRIMYGPPGIAYVYFTYGMHWMLNLVTESEGFPAAVLIRAIQPLEGISCMQGRRGGKPMSQLASGPAKLTQALGIAREENGLDCCRPDSPLTLDPWGGGAPILGGGHAPHRPGPDSRALAVQAVALCDPGKRIRFEVKWPRPGLEIRSVRQAERGIQAAGAVRAGSREPGPPSGAAWERPTTLCGGGGAKIKLSNAPSSTVATAPSIP